MTNETKTNRHIGKRALALAVAAALVLALAVAAYATDGFGLLRRAAAPGEKFHFSIAGPDGVAEGEWEDAKLVLEFDAPEACRAIRFKPGWLPTGYEEYAEGVNFTDGEGWYTRLTGEQLLDGRYGQPYLVEVFYAPQFVDGGHLILLTQEPGEIRDETWGEYQVMKFTASRTIPAAAYPDLGWESPEHVYERDYCILFHQTEGYLLVLSGDGELTDTETLEHIGQTLTIEHTDELVSAADYADYNRFLDGGKG